MYLLTYFLVVFWASERRFMYLSSFLEWAERDTGNRFTVNTMNEVEVVGVQVTFRPVPPRLLLNVCEDCMKKSRVTGLFDCIQAVNWSLNFDLRTLVSYAIPC